MQVTITTQPDPLLTSSDEIVRQSLALDGTDKDELVDVLLLAAQAELDGPLGWVGISVAQQSVQVTASSFDTPQLRLPGGPIIGDVEVTYLASDGTSTSLDSDSFVLLADGTLALVSGSSWPTLVDQENAITVAYDVGIEDENDPRVSLMKRAIIMHAGMNLDPPDDPQKTRDAIANLVRSLKVWTV